MQMLLRDEYPNGHFGDPALYIRDLSRRGSLLFDCGDLTRFSTRKLLMVSHIFLSHCHIDHFFGFDLFLRVHVGSERTVTIIGPPETAKRIGGKLQAYTWNLIHDQNLEFIVTEADTNSRKKHHTRFHAADAFQPTPFPSEEWEPDSPIVDFEAYQVRARQIDHRTPSMAYSITEKPAVSLNSDVLRSMNMKPGSWIEQLKHYFLFKSPANSDIQVPLQDGSNQTWHSEDLVRELLKPRERHKLAYVTDGAANRTNHDQLVSLVANADVLYCESCFLKRDEHLAGNTKHFTAAFVGRLARECGVKRLVPIHFSKRYLGEPDDVLRELRSEFGGEVTKLVVQPRQATL